AMAMAQVISSFGQPAIQMALKAVNAAQEVGLGEGQKLEASLFGGCCATEDFLEGTNAFLEKRKPAYKNR
ncbi:MAG: paaG, partial [Bacteroidetes bacterium]|nr:paaG [Bacteroidota bacterium]